MTVRELREYLDACEAACDDVDPPASKAEFDAAIVILRVEKDEDGNVEMGDLSGIEINDHADELAIILDGSKARAS